MEGLQASVLLAGQLCFDTQDSRLAPDNPREVRLSDLHSHHAGYRPFRRLPTERGLHTTALEQYQQCELPQNKLKDLDFRLIGSQLCILRYGDVVSHKVVSNLERHFALSPSSREREIRKDIGIE